MPLRNTLQQLRDLWETKLAESGCLDDSDGQTTAHEANQSGLGSAAPGEHAFSDGTLQTEYLYAGLKRQLDNIPQHDGSKDSACAEAVKMLPQHDGENCEEDDGEEQEVDDADLENLSDDLSDDEQPGKQDNLVLAQFEKVSRTKTRWKCQLKAGIMHVNGRDYIFNKATGEFQF